MQDISLFSPPIFGQLFLLDTSMSINSKFSIIFGRHSLLNRVKGSRYENRTCNMWICARQAFLQRKRPLKMSKKTDLLDTEVFITGEMGFAKIFIWTLNCPLKI